MCSECGEILWELAERESGLCQECLDKLESRLTEPKDKTKIYKCNCGLGCGTYTLKPPPKCCMTCLKMEYCPIIVLWVEKNSPVVVHEFYCSEYLRQGFPIT